MKKHTFPKEERLCSKRSIDGLFADGSSFALYPYRVLFMRTEAAKPAVQVMMAVSKRRFSKAVHRNLVKRRIREAYRLQKSELLYPALQCQASKLIIGIQYIGKEVLPFSLLHQKMARVLKELAAKLT